MHAIVEDIRLNEGCGYTALSVADTCWEWDPTNSPCGIRPKECPPCEECDETVGQCMPRECPDKPCWENGVCNPATGICEYDIAKECPDMPCKINKGCNVSTDSCEYEPKVCEDKPCQVNKGCDSAIDDCDYDPIKCPEPCEECKATASRPEGSCEPRECLPCTIVVG